MMKPKISIITVCLNAELEIKDTINSLTSQTFKDFEWIVIDGMSKDNTLKYAKQAPIEKKIVVSEKDEGLYDAMNKGIKLANGEFLIFLNAGDYFYDKDTLKDLMESCQHADIIYGETYIVDQKTGKPLGRRRLKAPENLTYRKLLWGMLVSHQSVLIRKEIVEFYDTKYKISADIDWLIRCLKKTRKICNARRYVTCFKTGGLSGKNVIPALIERFKIQVKHFGWIRVILAHLWIMFRFPVQYIIYRRKV